MERNYEAGDYCRWQNQSQRCFFPGLGNLLEPCYPAVSPAFLSAVASAVRCACREPPFAYTLLFLICHVRNQMTRAVRTVCKLKATFWEIARDPPSQEYRAIFQKLFSLSSQHSYLTPAWWLQHAGFHLQELYRVICNEGQTRDQEETCVPTQGWHPDSCLRHTETVSPLFPH